MAYKQWTIESARNVAKGVKFGYDGDRIAREFELDRYDVGRSLVSMASGEVIEGMTLDDAVAKYHVTEYEVVAAVERKQRIEERRMKEKQEKEFVSNGGAMIQKLNERVALLEAENNETILIRKLNERVALLEAENEKLREAVNVLLLS